MSCNLFNEGCDPRRTLEDEACRGASRVGVCVSSLNVVRTVCRTRSRPLFLISDRRISHSAQRSDAPLVAVSHSLHLPISSRDVDAIEGWRGNLAPSMKAGREGRNTHGK